VVQIAENWSRIEGTVVDWEPPRGADEPGRLRIRVKQVTDVAREDGSNYRNLVAASEEEIVTVQVPAAVASTLQVSVGDRVTLEVRRGRAPSPLFARAESIRRG
jgi:hypothetical protein